jgi:hypothetical protein
MRPSVVASRSSIIAMSEGVSLSGTCYGTTATAIPPTSFSFSLQLKWALATAFFLAF